MSNLDHCKGGIERGFLFCLFNQMIKIGAKEIGFTHWLSTTFLLVAEVVLLVLVTDSINLYVLLMYIRET